MGYDVNEARALHFTRMQQALEEGLKAIEVASSPNDVIAARLHAQRRLEDLNRKWAETLGNEDAGA